MSTSPALSVILPVRNGMPLLESAMKSVLQCSDPALELAVVDDGSTDETPYVVERLARRDARVRLIRQPARGIVAALTSGLAQTRGAYVARMDADDLSLPGRFETQRRFLDNHPDIGLVSCAVQFAGDTGALGYRAYVDWVNSLGAPEEISLNRFVESPLAHPTVMFRRELVAQHGAYRDGDFPEDYELWLRWLDAEVRMAKTPETLYVWRDSPGRLSRNDARYDVSAFYRCKADYLARCVKSLRAAAPRRLLVWGAGRHTRKRAEFLVERGVTIEGYIDIDPKKVGKCFAERPTIGPDQLPPPGRCIVLSYVANRGARRLIRQALDARGYREGVDYLCCA